MDKMIKDKLKCIWHCLLEISWHLKSQLVNSKTKHMLTAQISPKHSAVTLVINFPKNIKCNQKNSWKCIDTVNFLAEQRQMKQADAKM